jgi:hypothetical protein
MFYLIAFLHSRVQGTTEENKGALDDLYESEKKCSTTLRFTWVEYKKVSY